MNEPNEKQKPKAVERIYTAARKLSAEERELLLAMLEQDENSLTTNQAIKQAWVDESDRRIQLIEEGKAGWVEGEQALRDMRKHVAG